MSGSQGLAPCLSVYCIAQAVHVKCVCWNYSKVSLKVCLERIESDLIILDKDLHSSFKHKILQITG